MQASPILSMPSPSKKIFVIANSAWNLLNFRLPILNELLKHGFEVVAVCPKDGYEQRLREVGCRFEALAVDGRGTNVLRDVSLCLRLGQLLRTERPFLLLCYTAKPNIYGAILGRLLGIPVIANITGLGRPFIVKDWRTTILSIGYKFALRSVRRVVFQNRDDCDFFKDRRIVDGCKVEVVSGSGIDLDRFVSVSPISNRRFRFLFLGRLLKEKGLFEFINAARYFQAQNFAADFYVCGRIAEKGVDAISKEQIEQWHSEGLICYDGEIADVRAKIEQSDCVVLPSYREGVPRVLLEASAMGRPVIATNVPGCREVVEDGVNGLLCSPRSFEDLAEKMRMMVYFPEERRIDMGRSGRKIVEGRFDQKFIVASYMEMILGIE